MGSRTNLLLIFLIFTLSIFIRLPNIDRPLSSNYEWVTAHTLVTLSIWEKEGITNHNFNPIYTFPNANDHYVKCPISGVSNSLGDYYYVSYPPFSFIFPHLFFDLFRISPSTLSLQIFNITLHLLCSILLFIIISQVASLEKSKVNYPALLGSAIYILSPLNLWNHANVYFADILVQLFFLLTLLFSLRFHKANNPRLNDYLFLLLSVFFMMYTEWLGYLMALCLIAYALFNKRFFLFTWLTFTSLCVIIITLFQYSSISGIDDYLQTLLNRYSERSGQYGRAQIYQVESHLFLLQMYLRNYFPYLIILLFTFLVSFITRKTTRISLPGSAITILLLSLIPVVLHHILLFEFTIIHELSLVKSSIFIAIFIGLVSKPVFSTVIQKKNQVEGGLYFFVTGMMFLLGVYFYYSHIITPDEYASLRLGNQIKETSSEVDTIFFKSSQTYGDFLIKAPDNFVIAPQIQYYSERCIQVVPNTTEAIQHLQTYNKKQGIIYTIENPFYKIESVERIQNPNTSSLSID